MLRTELKKRPKTAIFSAFKLSLISLALLQSVAATAQATEVPATDLSIERISVEGQSQTAVHSMHRVDESQIQAYKTAGSDTASLLAGLPGVQLNAAGALSSLIAIRGLADDRVRIKVDGMDYIAACPNHMNPPLSYLAPSEVGSITVFAGLTPVSAGGDSIGGSVIAESKAPAFSKIAAQSGELGTFYRSNNQAFGAHLTMAHSSELFYASYSGSQSQGDNYRAGGRDVGSTAYETQNHSLRVAKQLDENVLDLQLGYQNMPLQLYPNQRMDLLGNTQKRVNFSWNRELSWGEVESRVYSEHVDHKMNFGPDKQFWYGSLAADGQQCSPIAFHGDPSGTCAAGMPMLSGSVNHGFNLSTGIRLDSTDLIRLGSELQKFSLDDYWTASGAAMGPDTFLNINNGQRNRLTFFAERDQQITKQWRWLYGARVEQVTMDADPVHGYSSQMNAMGMQFIQAKTFNESRRDSKDINTDLTVLASYQPSSTLSMELGVARKVRSPNLYEKYTWSAWAMAAGMNNLVGDGNGYVGNLQLKPEEAHTLSASLSWHSSNHQHQLVIRPYVTEVADYIDAVAGSAWAAGQFNILRYQNQDTKLQGVDINWQNSLAQTQVGQWRLQGSLSFIDSKNRVSGDALYNTVPLQGRLVLQHSNDDWQNSLEWVMAAPKQQLSVVRNEIETPGYGLINLRLSRSWPQFRADLGVENLFDRFYVLPSGGSYTGKV